VRIDAAPAGGRGRPVGLSARGLRAAPQMQAAATEQPSPGAASFAFTIS
jgi:hypothetical protein